MLNPFEACLLGRQKLFDENKEAIKKTRLTVPSSERYMLYEKSGGLVQLRKLNNCSFSKMVISLQFA
jgi:hypothetical protein